MDSEGVKFPSVSLSSFLVAQEFPSSHGREQVLIADRS